MDRARRKTHRRAAAAGRQRSGTRVLATTGLVTGLLIMLVGVGGSTTAGAASSSTAWKPLCGSGESATTGSPVYRVDNGDAPGGSTCIAVNDSDTQFTVADSAYSASAGETDSQSEGFTGYLNIYTGCVLNRCLERNYPIEAGDVQRELTNWAFGFSADGKFDAAYDMFFNTAPTQSAHPTGGELMIWLNHQNVGLQGPELADTTIDGARWHVYSVYKRTDNGNWWRIAFERATPVTSVRSLDIAPFIKAAVADGALKDTWYQMGLQAGFEVWNGGVGLSTYSFAAGVPNAGVSTAASDAGPASTTGGPAVASSTAGPTADATSAPTGQGSVPTSNSTSSNAERSSLPYAAISQSPASSLAIGPPRVRLVTARHRRAVAFGRRVATRFSCAEAAGGPGIRSCVDSNGARHGRGRLVTGRTGRLTYSVTAISKDGKRTVKRIVYFVRRQKTA